MGNTKRVKFIEKSLIVVCVLFGLFALTRYLFFIKDGGHEKELPQIEVSVTGNVKNPGKHRIPWGSNVYTLLQVAGVNQNSDLNNVQLSQVLNDGEKIQVGKLSENVKTVSAAADFRCRLDFFEGPVDHVHPKKKSRRSKIGEKIATQSRLITQMGAQAQVEWVDRSRIILTENTEVEFLELGEKIADKRRTNIFVKKGKLWGKISRQGTIHTFRFETPHMNVIIQGTEFVMDITGTETNFKLYDGVSYVEKKGQTEGYNVVAGQKAVSAAGNTPLRLSELAEGEGAEEFNLLYEERKTYYKKNKDFMCLICGVPDVYMLLKVNPAKKKIVTMHIPTNTFVGDVVRGFDEFEKAFLYGGAKFTASVIERILSIKMEKYIVFTPRDVRSAVDVLGGIEVLIDARASTALSVSSGISQLNGQQAVRFLSPSISGPQDAYNRQRKVLESFFNGLRSKNIVLSTSSIARILSSGSGNLDVAEAVDVYNTFNSVKGWKMIATNMPGDYFTRSGKNYLRVSKDEVTMLLE